MIIYDKNIYKRDINKIEKTIDVNTIKEETAIIVDNVAYIFIEEGENFIVQRINNLI